MIELDKSKVFINPNKEGVAVLIDGVWHQFTRNDVRMRGEHGNSGFIDLTNHRFYNLMVIKKHSEKSKRGDTLWVCLCDCGVEKLCTTGNLNGGGNRSCGCRVGGKKYDNKRNRIRRIWLAMNSRCQDRVGNKYKHHGAKGIRVCVEWQDYEVFNKWAIGNGYMEHLTLERINNDNGYCPENCKWATYKEQANNVKTNVWIEFNGQTKTMAQWAEVYGLSPLRLRRRLVDLGWSIEKALTTPIDKNKINKRYRNGNTAA